MKCPGGLPTIREGRKEKDKVRKRGRENASFEQR
jgi:hypothetical protein